MKIEFKDVIKLMDSFSSSPVFELYLKSGDTELRLKKEEKKEAVPARQVAAQAELPSQVESIPQEETLVEPQMIAKNKKAKNSSSASGPTENITSPLVGTFYRSPSPDSPPFVSEGDVVKKGQSIAIIEAMKIMNHFEAEFDMEIVTIHRGNGDMVEFGSLLFEVRRT